MVPYSKARSDQEQPLAPLLNQNRYPDGLIRELNREIPECPIALLFLSFPCSPPGSPSSGNEHVTLRVACSRRRTTQSLFYAAVAASNLHHMCSRKMGSNYPFLMEHILHVSWWTVIAHQYANPIFQVQIVVRTKRLNIKCALEQIVIRFFGFSADLAHNQQRSQELLPNGFHQLVCAPSLRSCKVSLTCDRSPHMIV